MSFHLALVGQVPEDAGIKNQIDALMDALTGGLKPAVDQVQLLASPIYTGREWYDTVRRRNWHLSLYSACEDAFWDGVCDRIIREETSAHGVVGEELCDQADLILAVWDEDVSQMHGAVWELIRLAWGRGVPCIWLSSRTGKLYWSENSFYEAYTEERLEALCRFFQTQAYMPETCGERKVPLLKLGEKLYRRYMRKHRSANGEIAPEKDRMLQDGFSLAAETPEGESLRHELVKRYREYDGAAVNYNARYQAVLYWRAILPFVASVFIAVGFYAETMLGALLMKTPVWSIVAGIGFLVHALLNLYVYSLSRSETIKTWHRNYLDSRYIAELIRVVIHFAPYGVSLNLRRLCGGYNDLYITMRGILRRTAMSSLEVNRSRMGSMLGHVEEMIEDQISYHQVSAKRYGRITEKLEKWHKSAFALGFVAVVLRSLLQFVITISPISSGYVGEVELNKFVGTFANMLALMLPAWASYFASKNATCNFRYNADNHLRMAKRLGEELAYVRALRQEFESVPMEVFGMLCEHLAEIMLVEDTNAWHRKYADSTIKML